MIKQEPEKAKSKKLLIELMPDIHKAAKMRALELDMTLHSFIVEAIKEKTGAKK